MLKDTETRRLRDELKRLNTRLGAVRDIDVAIDRIRKVAAKRPENVGCFQVLERRRLDGHRQLARTLQSANYWQLVDRTSAWIEHGPWSAKNDKDAAKARAKPVVSYASEKLARWEKKLLKKSRRLLDMDMKKRHELRLLNKKLNYSIQSLEDLLSNKRLSEQKSALKYLKKAQRYLGELNDDFRAHTLALTLEREGVATSFQFLGPKREKRLLKATSAAYDKLAALKLCKS